MDLDRIAAAPLVESLEFHPAIGSTNDRALAAAAEGTSVLPLLVLAAEQTAGRGRGANRWFAAGGSLPFSLLIDTAALRLPMSRWPQLSLTTGVALCEALSDLLPGAPVGLKWPNDVWIAGRKACGILIEPPPRIAERLVIGVGVNVNNSFAAAPDEVRERAVSLAEIAGAPLPLTDVLLTILRHFARCWRELADEPGSLVPRWQEYDCLRGRTIELSAGSQVHRGQVAGLDADGALILDTASGSTRHLSGTVTAIFQDEDRNHE